MTPQEATIIQQWHNGRKRDIRIRLLLTEDKRSEDFSVFADRFAALAPSVHIQKETADTAEMPAILITPNIRYRALPSGKTLEPFLNALTRNHTPPAGGILDPGVLENIKLPMDLDLYIAPQCGFCPATVTRLIGLALHCPLIRLSIIDAFLFSERSQNHGIRSVPTVLLGKRYRWTGTFDMQELVDMMVHQDPAHLQASTLQNMIQEGNAAQVAEMMLEYGQIFPAFLELLFHEKWPVRLGAMVVMEEMIEKNIGLVASVVDTLWEGSKTVDEPIKGDIYYLLGEAADATVIPKLQTVLSDDPGKELKEAVEEAIARIKERCKPM